MTPTNSSNNRGTAPGAISSKGVIWQGPDLQCINVCKGDTVTDVVYSVATQVCEVLDSLDLSDIEFKCLIDTCLACPEPDKTLKTALRLLINKVCTLEELLKDASNQEITIPVFQVNLKCLAITDGSGNILNDDTNDKIIQSIVDQVCINTANIILIQNDITSLDSRVTQLEEAEPPELIPDVTSNCLFLGNKPLDEAVGDLDAAYCETLSGLGTSADMNKAVAQQCADLAQKFVLNPNFTISPQNMAQSIRNMWIALCDTINRVTIIENTCCQATCEQIKVGFSIIFSEVQTATLKFTNGAGTNIPVGVVDCGSTLVVSDETGYNVVVENMNINNNVEVPDIDLTGFTAGMLLTFTLTAKFCSEALGTCEKVVVKTAVYKNACSTCEITNSGDGEVIVVFDSFGPYITNNQSVTVVNTSSTTSSSSTTVI